MRLVYLILLLFFPIAADAAPVGAAIAAWYVAATAVQVAMVVMQVAMMAYSIYGAAQQRRKAKRDARRKRDEYNASLSDRLITQVVADASYVYVYGRAKVGSTVVAMFTSGAKDEYKHLVCVHAAHECDGIEEIYVAGKALGPLTGDGLVTGGDYYKTTTDYVSETRGGITFDLSFVPNAGTLVVGKNFGGGTEFERNRRIVYTHTVVGKTVTITDPGYVSGAVTCRYRHTYNSSTVRVQKHLGTPDDPVDPYLHSLFPDKWPATAVLRGFCYTVITLDLNQPEFQGGIPSVEVLLRGKKLYDPRTGLTTWNQNNALVVRDYLTSELCGVGPDDLPLSQYIAAANVCDESIGELGARYTFNGTVTSDQDQASVLEQMAQSMAGGIVSTTWDIYAGKYVAPVMVLDQEDIVGQIAITPGVSDADLYNGVKGQYISDETSYVATDIKPYQNEAYVESDGRELWTDINFPFTDKIQRVHNLARIFTEDQRNGYTVKAEYSLKAWKLKVGQRVVHNSAFFGWNSKIFRVTDKQFSPTSAVELTLKEDAPEIWDLADAVTVDATPNTNLKNPFFLDPPASLTCESGTEHLLLMQDGTIVSRIKASWPAVVADIVEVEWTDGDVWSNTKVNGSDTSVYLSPVTDGAYYTVRARAFNPYLNVKSDWTYAEFHQVIGKSEPPADMQNLFISGNSLNWTLNTELDRAGSRFKFHYGNNRDWGTAVPLHEGMILSSPFEMSSRPGGVVTIMGKNVDTSENESVNAAIIVVNLGDAPIENVVETVDFRAGGFSGALENCSVIGGDLLADATDSFYGTDNQSFYGPDNEPFYAEESYAQMVYTTGEIYITSALAGSNVTLEIAYQGTDLFIEYRLSGPDPTYGTDSDSFYGADDDPFYGSPSAWMPWPGQIAAENDVYQWRVTLGAGAQRGTITALAVVIDAPDMVEYLEDVPINAAGTVIPYTKNFTVIKTVTTTLQANSSGAETIEVDKTINLSPTAKAYDAAHVAVSGAMADFIIKGH